MNTLAEISISKFTKKGHGIGSTTVEPRREVEVPFTMPGETVQATLMRKRRGLYSSRLEEVLIPSQQRVNPRCAHAGTCGGCRWQHISYEEQLKIKQDNISRLFQPLVSPQSKSHNIIACDPPWQYRNKMEFTFSSDAAGNRYLGLIIDGSRGKVLNLKECHLVNPWFISALEATRQWWNEWGLAAYHPHTNQGTLRTLTVREGMRTGDRLVMLTVSGNPEYALNRQHLESFVAYLRDAIEPMPVGSQLSVFLRIHQAVKGQATNFYEMVLHGSDHIRETLYIKGEADSAPIELTFTVSPTAFFQPNTRQAEKLYSAALQLLQIPANQVVYDLYCGTGTLGICAARWAKQVVGIELSPESSLDARANAARNGMSHVTILTGSASDVLQMIRQNNTFPMPEVVMVDPPRAGLDAKMIQHLSELKPNKLLYISCNPETQVENIKELQQIGYRLTDIQPVDQFPHTVHIENIAVLSLGT